MSIIIIYILVLLIISALPNIAEAAIFTITRSNVEILKKEGKKSAKYLIHIKDNMEKYIASLLVLITIANSFGVIYAEEAIKDYFPSIPKPLSIGILTFLIITFGEFIPKTIGVKNAILVSRLSAIPLFYITKILYPVLFTSELIARLLGLTKKSDKPEFSKEEIESITTLSAKEGSIDSLQEDIIKNILFLKEIPARQVITPRRVVFALQKDMTIDQSVEKYGNWQFSRVPLYDQDLEHIVGHVLRKDAYNCIANNQEHTPLVKLVRPLLFVPESISLDKLLHQFLHQRAHMAAVIDEYGGFAGVVTLEDVLETLIGKEIVDESDITVDLQEYARKQSKAWQQMQKNTPSTGNKSS